MTCREAILEVFSGTDRILSTNDVVSKIYAKYSDEPWQRNTISAHLIGLSVNHSSSHHYPSFRKHAFLYSLGNGRYRLYDPDADGSWVVTDRGVELADSSDDVAIAEDENDNISEMTGVSLSLERDLESNLIGHLDQLEPGLSLFNEGSTRGQQVETGAVGRLDLLATDAEGNIVVIELKVGMADDRVVGQILRYMGWAKRDIANGRNVRGIIVASSFNERIKYAVDPLPNVKLVRYGIQFTFAPAE
jgi:hypothetical protein